MFERRKRKVFAVKNADKSISLSGPHIGRKEQYLTKNGKILAFSSRYDAEQLVGKMLFECKVVELEMTKPYFTEVIK